MKRMLLSMLCGFCAACLLAACAPAPAPQPTPTATPQATPTPSPTARGEYLTDEQLIQALAQLSLPVQPTPPQGGTKYYLSDVYADDWVPAPIKAPSGTISRRGLDRLAKRLEEPSGEKLSGILADFGLKGGGAENIGALEQADPNDGEEKVYTEIWEYENGFLLLNRVFSSSANNRTPYYGTHLLFKEVNGAWAFVLARSVSSSFVAYHHTGTGTTDALWGEEGWRYFVCECNTTFSVDGDYFIPCFYPLDVEEPSFSFWHGRDYDEDFEKTMQTDLVEYSQDSLTLLPDGRLAFSMVRELSYQDTSIGGTRNEWEKMEVFNYNVTASYALTLYNDRDGLGFYSYDENLSLFFRGIEDIPHVQAQLLPKLDLLLRSEREEVRERAATVLRSLA